MTSAPNEGTSNIRDFAVTFGVQYKNQPHPILDHPNVADGYVVIEAPDEDTARKIAENLFDDTWSMLYDSKFPRYPRDSDFFPLGEIARYSWSKPNSTEEA